MPSKLERLISQLHESRKPRRKPKPAAPKLSGNLYRTIANRANARINAESRAARDIAPCPEITDRYLRDKCIAELPFFLKHCFPATFTLPWSEDHKKILDAAQETVIHGGKDATAMERGGGKSSIFRRAVLWAILCGHRRFPVLVGDSSDLSSKSLKAIQSELSNNDTLLGLFPKMVYPLRRLEGQSRRCVGQLYEGKRTLITWLSDELIFPYMPGPDNQGSGSILFVRSLEAAARGLQYVMPTGETLRPDLLLIDDPQNRESAKSLIQTANRLATIRGDLLGCAGPGKEIAAMLLGTVIYNDDLMDQLLDRDKNPDWRGQKYKMVYSFPVNVGLWDEYARVRKESQRAEHKGEEATEFYKTNRAEMDAGAIVAWPERFDKGEISALQHAMNIKIDRPEEFDAEYQNEPRRRTNAVNLDANEIIGRVNGLERGTAGQNVEKLTAFIDVGDDLLWWMVCGWAEDSTCNILDYGCTPDQRSRMFFKRNASPTLIQTFPAPAVVGSIYAGLMATINALVSRQWRRVDRAELQINRILVDTGHEKTAVRECIFNSPHRRIITPSKGMGFGPGQRTIDEFRSKPGQRRGPGWLLTSAKEDRMRLLLFDANKIKTRAAELLVRPMGMRGCASLYGGRAGEHQLVAMHLASEMPLEVKARGITTTAWSAKPDMDNDWFDCFVGCVLGAMIEGIDPMRAILPARAVARPTRRRGGVYYID